MKIIASKQFPYYISLVCLIALTGFIFLDTNDLFLNYYLIISDAMYLPSMYEDLVVNGNALYGWNVNPAPNFFPDIPLYFLLNWVFGNFQDATAAYGLVQTALTSLLLLGVFTKISKNGYFYATLANVLLLLLPFIHFIDNEYIFSIQLIINSFHHSAFLNGLACLIYLFSFLNSKNKLWLVAILLHGILGLISDQLLLVTFIVPAFLVALLSISKHKKHSIYLLFTLILTFFSGFIIFNQLKAADFITIPAPHKYLAYDNIIASVDMLGKQLNSYFTITRVLGWMLGICILSFLLLTVKSIQKLPAFLSKSKADNVNNSNYFQLFSVIFIVIVMAAPVINGSYTGYDTIRYNYFAYILGVAVFPYSVIRVLSISQQKIELASRIGAVLSVIVIITAAAMLPLKSYREYKDFYPDRVRELDEIAKDKNLEYGVAPYSEAKIITLFSKQNLKVYTVFEDLAPWLHVSNPNWYVSKVGEKGNRAEFGFVITANENADNIAQKKIGSFIESIQLSNFKVNITEPFGYEPGNYSPLLLRSQE